MSTITSEMVFRLNPYGSLPRGTEFAFIVITPPNTSHEAVIAAWSYAIRYTAKGLDLPDHEAALQKLSERHPSWKIIASKVQEVIINLGAAENDVPEN